MTGVFCLNSLLSTEVKSCATRRCSTPPGPEGSNGRHTVLCDTGKLDLFLYGPALTGQRLQGPLRGPRPVRKCGENNHGSYHYLFTLTVSYCLSRAIEGSVPDHRACAKSGSLWKRIQTNVVARRLCAAASGAFSISSRNLFLVAEAEAELVSL